MKLSKEEKQIRKDFREGRFEFLPDSEMESYAAYAHAQLKDAKVTIRLPSSVVNGLKKEAARKKTRYQTLMGKILADHVSRNKAA
jgi:predicted DNA binding CopG/RHH family protein